MKTIDQYSTLEQLKAALLVLPTGPSNIAQFTASLRNPEGESITRANIYMVCGGRLKLEWLQNAIYAKIKECRFHYPEAFEMKLREMEKPRNKVSGGPHA